MPVALKDDTRSPEVLRTFYQKLFPFKLFYLWLNQDHVPSRLWTHRELAFTLQGDIYVRYNSFASSDEFKKELLRTVPTRFEIGPVYNVRRELVFDIDMTDYDEIRTCCSGGAICRKCWGYISASVKVLDHSLRETFGFRHLLWIYSGRRGVHCWISDRQAMELTDDQRRSLVNFLEVVKGGKDQVKKVNVRSGLTGDALHPDTMDAVDILKEPFVRIVLGEQDIFREEKDWQVLLQLLSLPQDKQQSLAASWTRSDKSSESKWRDLMQLRSDLKEKQPALEAKLERSMTDIMLQYTYPRIDAEVSKRRNHLLKSPFVIHPSTGRVCVPLDPTEIDDFDPESVPTVGQLLREIDRAALVKSEEDAEMEDVKTEDGVAKKVEPDWSKTSLAPYIARFEQHVSAVLKDARQRKPRGQISLDF